MATHKPAPLRDRLLSNSPDPIKSSILRESGAGWASLSTNSIHSSTSGTITSPLRIAKRDSPVIPRGANVARRSSSSFKHVRDNNLVTNSPFKIQGPSLSTPSRPSSVVFPTRRVSGEKRPRPLSMHEDAENENDRPTALKRDRKQSRVFQGLLEKEPVTRSPFKQFERMGGMDGAPPSPPPIPKIPYLSNPTPIAAIASRLTPISREPSPPANGPSPGRSSLVSRRLHGPRLSGGGKRERRKTVTFDERCDVVEFDRDTSDEEYWEGSEDGERYGEPYQDAEEGDPFFRGDEMTDEPPRSELQAQIAQLAPHATLDEDSYESAHISDTDRATTTTTLLDTDTSITGLVEEMFFSSNAALINADAIGSSTPSRISDIPTDLETEDGIPFGRSHHAERLLQHHQQESPQRSQPPPRFSPHVSPHSSHASAHQSPQIGKMADFSGSFSRGSPNQCGHPMTPPHIPVVPAQSTPPLGRLTHLERAMKAREEEKGQMEEVGADAEKLPISPSPVRSTSTPPTRSEGLIPKYKWPRGAQHGERRSPSVGADPFEIHERKHSRQDQSMSISLAAPDVSREARQEAVQEEEEEILAGINDHDSTRLSVNPSPRLEIPPRFASSSIPVTSPLNLSQSSNSPRAMSPRPNVRHRISKDNIRRRLTERRSSPSPSPEPNSQFDAVMERIESYPTPEVQFGKTEGPDPQEVIVPHFEEPEVQAPEHDKERDRMSIFSALTDVSIETATVQRAEKFNVAGGLPTPDSLSETEFGMPEASTSLQLNLGNKFSLGGMGLARSNSIVHSKEALSVPSQGHEVDAGSVHSGTSGTSVKVGDMDVNMDMKSALDRLMDDVAGAGSHEEDSMMTDEYDKSQDQSLETTRPPKVQRTATDSDLLHTSGLSGRFASGSSIDSIPPPPPPKDNNIKAREQLILEKRREARRAEEGGFVPRRGKGQRLQAQLGLGRPTRRRSMSAGDAQDLAKRQLLSVGGDMEQLVEEDLLSHSIERELRKLDRENSGKKSKYHVREREGTIYASASDDKVSHMDGAGDLETGRAWRTVRRPSDMNEYSKQIKEYRSQANPTKAYGKVFVKVLGIKGVRLPLPQEPTALTCTLNNGIHFVTTPECELGLDCRIDQEFELIEHSKLEFTLTLKVRRDPHIVSQFKALAPTPAPPPPPPPIVQQSTSRGMRAFFSSSPKKHSKDKAAHQPPPPPPPPIHRLPENLARYLKPDGTLARAFIQFKDIATKCDTRLFETSYPLIGQRVELGGKFSTLQVGEIVLQIFRLPPLPGIPPDQLPQSLEECHRGLRHINWHKVTYFEGILTQNGGDCNTWRRRLFRVIGANLVAFNDVTRKATATIDLKKAIAVQDDQDIRNPLSPLARSRGYDDDALFGVERSFRLIFPQDQEIIFFADTDEEKFRWLEVLRALVGHIPPHPLWAELLWQRQEEASKRTDKSVDQSSMPAAQGTPSSRQR
ncbi:Bud site selection protein BUD4 [Leucoagaricus sp. SymC.cos]|nr:Bud site selection protein BUD4 [Leucoagaricus sp. SymC.cos]